MESPVVRLAPPLRARGPFSLAFVGHHRRLIAGVAASILLASCGGGGSSDDPPSAGAVYPPEQGLVMVEYDADGEVIQSSSATDAKGRFKFARAVSGHRIESTQPGLRWEAATTRSALLDGSPAALHVTPFTTVRDQWVMAGASKEEARAAVLDTIGHACGTTGFPPDDGRTLDVNVALAPERWAAALALAAYLDALRDLGLDPVAARPFWREEFNRHREVLAAVCSAAQQVYAKPWMDALIARLAAGGLTTPGSAPYWLAEVRESAARQVLKLVAGGVAHARYPELAAATALGQPWTGSPVAASMELALAEAAVRVAPATTTTDPNALVAGVRFRLDRLGAVESSIHTLVRQDTTVNSVQLTNTDNASRTVRLILNGVEVGGLGSVLREILAQPQTTPHQSLPERVWRWAVARHRHQYPLTGRLMIHQPDLYFHSLGFGFCDDASSAMQWILVALGIETRVWELGGHVVVEAKEDGRWVSYDPDLKIHYRLRDGRKAGVQDLADDPSLITDPVDPVDPLVPRGRGVYSADVASIYASKSDNWIPALYATPIASPLQPEFVVPPGARIEVDRGAAITVPTIDPSTTERVQTLRLWLPPGYVGAVSLPLLLVDVTGQGTVRFADRALPAGGAEVRAALDAFYRDPDASQSAIGQVEVAEVGPAGLSLVMAVNPYYFERSQALDVRFLSPDPKALILSVTREDAGG
jgi:hypothetical protein